MQPASPVIQRPTGEVHQKRRASQIHPAFSKQERIEILQSFATGNRRDLQARQSLSLSRVSDSVVLLGANAYTTWSRREIELHVVDKYEYMVAAIREMNSQIFLHLPCIIMT